MTFSSFLACGLQTVGMLDDGGDNTGSGFSIVDYMRDIPLCCAETTTLEDDSFPTNDIQEISPPGERVTQNRTTITWSPPLYRDKSLLADSSSHCVQDTTPSPSSTAESPSATATATATSIVYNESTPSRDTQRPHAPTNEGGTDPNSLRAAFIPPKHAFPIKRDKQAQSIECLSSSASGLRLQRDDVVCGRGGPSNNHPGNLAFKEVIREHEMEYLCSKRNEKPKIAMKLMTKFQADGVRFVKRIRNQKGAFEWVEIGEQRAFEKVCQSLREDAPQLRRQLVAAEAARSSRAKKRRRIQNQSLQQSQQQSLQRRQDSSTGFSNEASNDYDIRHQPSFALSTNSRSDEPHRIPNTPQLRYDEEMGMDHSRNRGKNYDASYCTHLLPPHLGGERLFGERAPRE